MLQKCIICLVVVFLAFLLVPAIYAAEKSVGELKAELTKEINAAEDEAEIARIMARYKNKIAQSQKEGAVSVDSEKEEKGYKEQVLGMDEGYDAEDMESMLFEEIPIVYSSSFFARNITDTPGYTTVIKASQLEESPARSVKDAVLYFVPGMSELIHENVGPMFAVRGVGVDTNAKTLVMLDGQHLNHRQHFGYSTELAVPLIGDIAQIEVVNGPGAIVHGSGAISGFVNMVPKNGTDFPEAFVKGEWGPKEELYKIESGFGKSYGSGRDIYIYAGILQAAGDKAGWPWPIDLTGAEPDARRGFDLYDFKSNAFPDPTGKVAVYWNYDKFSLNTFYREETYGINGTFYRWQGAGDVPSWMTASLGVRPKYKINLTEYETLDLNASAILMQHGHKGDSTSQLTDENDSQFDSEQHYEFKAIGKTTRIERHSIAFGGVVGRKSFKQDDIFFHSNPASGSGEGETGAWLETGLFVEDIMQLTDKWSFSAGWRFDEIDYDPVESQNNFEPPSSNNTSWRFVTAYDFDHTSNIKLSYQEGFRYIDMAYLHWHSVVNERLAGLGYGSLPSFEPETMSSVELNLHKSFEDAKVKVDLNVYQNTYDKMLHWHTFSTTNTAGMSAAAVQAVIDEYGWMGCHLNAPGKFRTMGFEVIGSWQALDNVKIDLSYGYSVPTQVPDNVYESLSLFTDDKKDWFMYPTHQIKGMIVTKFLDDKLTLTFAPLFDSGIDWENVSSISNISTIYDKKRFVLDCSAEYQITEKLSAKLTIDNLFEEDVPARVFKLRPYMGALGEDERWIYLSMKYDF